MANVKRTTINLDTDLLSEAQQMMGTATMTDTVHAALDEAIRKRKIEEMLAIDFSNLTDEEWQRVDDGLPLDVPE